MSHHFLMWAYQGANAADFPSKSQLQNGEACLDFGPADREQRVLIAGSQSVKQRQLLPTGLAQEIDPVDEGGKKVMDRVKVFARAASLGDTRSLIVHSASTSHRAVPRDQRLAIGVTDGLVRLSVGIEAADDLLQDLDQALAW